MFTLGGIAGVFDRGFKRMKYVRSEVNLLTIGPAWICPQYPSNRMGYSGVSSVNPRRLGTDLA